MAASVKLLHLSDLHFDERGAPSDAGGRDPQQMRQRLAASRSEQFLNEFRATLQGTTKDSWPKYVLVTGDLVNFGGGTAWEAAFENARDFLKKLAVLLDIRDEQIYIVPGNHDVDWSPGLAQPARFRRFNDKLGEFTIPQFNGSNPGARLVQLPNLVEGVSIELLLLISPTFSGVVDRVPSSLMKAVCDVFPEASGEDRVRLEEALQSARGTLDIAAIGPHQRDKITRMEIDPEPVRIAMLHHHLLPHPEVEAGPFESVLDAGPVIEELLPRFDLALTGHKHTRRLMQLRKGNEFLDVYTGPSLFHGHQGSRSGFTIVDVHGSNGAYYATLQHWHTGEHQPFQQDSLIRRGRVDPEINDICAQIDPAVQKATLVPLLQSTTRGLQWSSSHRASRLAQQFWETIIEDVQTFSEKAVIFRPPNLSDRWRELLGMAATSNAASLRLVSDADLEFWLDAARKGTDAWFYERHVRSFGGPKRRALVLEERHLKHEQARVAEVVEDMASYMDVSIILKNSVPHDVPRDFGIIADLAVSNFRGTDLTGRSLKEDFGASAKARAEQHWNLLMGAVRWESGTQAISDWLSQF